MEQGTRKDDAAVRGSKETTPERDERRRRLTRLIQAGIAIVVVGAAFLGVLPRISDLDRVWTIVRSLSWIEVLILVALSAWNIVTYWPMLVAAMPGLTLGQAAVVCQSSTSVAMTLPGGGAIAVGVSYSMYTSWGFSPASIALSTLLTGIVNMSFKFLLPVVALAALALNGESDTELLSTAVAGVGVVLVTTAILAGMLRRERFAYRIGVWVGGFVSFFLKLVRRPGVGEWGAAALTFRAKLIKVLRDRGVLLATAEVVSQLSLYLVFLASLRFVGIPDSVVSWAQVLTVFAFVRLGTAIPIVPGNVGIVELGYIGGLALAGAPREEAVAAVLVFRFLTFFFQIPLGALTYAVWRRRQSWRRPRLPAHQEHPAPDAGEIDGPADGHGGSGMVERCPDCQDQQPAVPTS
jgi:putative heme transporter